MKRLLLIVGVAAITAMSGCGGSGGSGTSAGSSTVGAFVRWSAVPNPGSVRIRGEAVYQSYTAPPPTYQVTSLGAVTQTNDAEAVITYRADGSISAIDLQIPKPGGVINIRWDESAGDSIVEGSRVVDAVDAAGRNYGRAANAIPQGWEYQTFGVWLTGYGTGSGTFGALSVGAQTPVSGVPTTGTATFAGGLLGAYVDAGGAGYLVEADFTANVDFASRTVSISSTNTVKTNVNTGAVTTAADLNLTGTLTYYPATNGFAGSVATAGGLSGSADGQFYGPGAEELGGTFFTGRSGSVESFIGSFGAKR